MDLLEGGFCVSGLRLDDFDGVGVLFIFLFVAEEDLTEGAFAQEFVNYVSGRIGERSRGEMLGVTCRLQGI